jgi:hypothetical protein
MSLVYTTALPGAITGQQNLNFGNNPSQTLNTSLLNNVSIQSNLDDMFKIINSNSEHIKRYEIIETTEDLLAISVAHRRIISNPPIPHRIRLDNILDDEVVKLVTTEDKEEANKIRKYYGQQLIMWTLKGLQLSPFRKDLQKYVNGDSNKFQDTMIKLVTKLPYFYSFDIEFDEVKREFDEIPSSINILKSPFVLTPVKSLIRKNKRIKCVEYWLKDSNNWGYKIQIEINNPLQHIWDKHFNNNSELTLAGIGTPKRLDDLKYFQLLNWKLL